MGMPVPIWFFLIGLVMIFGATYLPVVFGGMLWWGVGIAGIGVALAFFGGSHQ